MAVIQGITVILGSAIREMDGGVSTSGARQDDGRLQLSTGSGVAATIAADATAESHLATAAKPEQVRWLFLDLPSVVFDAM